MSKDQFSIVSVERYNGPFLSNGYLQDFPISDPCTICSNGFNIDSCGFEEVSTL